MPTYRRSTDIVRCLAGLASQSRRPEQVIVVVRADDQATLAALETSPGHIRVTVSDPGQVHALASGLRTADTDIVAFTDDDAIPRSNWIAGIADHFLDPHVGGVGGRDIIPSEASQPLSSCVGLLGRWGRVVGNHHVGAGGPRDVDVLKGVNMAFRRHLVRFPKGLRGEGSEVHNDLALCLWVRTKGWRLVYDPALIVDHFPGIRPSTSPRRNLPARATRDQAYNQAAALLATKMLSTSRVVAYGLLCGDRACPGPGRCLVGFARGEGQELSSRVLPATQGRLGAYWSYMRGSRLGYDEVVA